MKYTELRVSWSEHHHKDVQIEVPDDFDGVIYEDIEDQAIEEAKAENRMHPRDSCDDTHNYVVEEKTTVRTMVTTQCQICGAALDITELNQVRKYVCKNCRKRNPMYLSACQTAPLA